MRSLTTAALFLYCVSQAPAQIVDGSFIDKFDRYYDGFVFSGEKKNVHHEVAWKGERVSFQVLLWSAEPVSGISFQVSDFTGVAGIISKSNFRILMPTFVKGDEEARSCGEYAVRKGMRSIADALHSDLVTSLKQQDTVAVWISAEIPAGTVPGKYSGQVMVSAGAESRTFTINIEIAPFTLPAREEWSFHLDLWQFPTAGLLHYNDTHPLSKIAPWSDAHFDLIRPAYQILADAGQRVITAQIKHGALGTPSMIEWIRNSDQTWTYDFTAFDRYVSEMIALGIDAQISCFSPVGWNEQVIPYRDELTQSMKELEAPLGSEAYQVRWDHFLTAFKLHLEEKGWFDITVLYLDEVSESKLAGVVQTVRGNDPKWKLGIAYSHGLSEATRSDFYDMSGILEQASQAGISEEKISTFYTSCTQTFPNNYVTVENSTAEMAWMAFYSANKKFDGYLRWAFDNWTRRDPLDIRDGAHTAGDFAFIYRGGNTSPMRYYTSIRLEMLREGIEEYEKISVLRETYRDSADPWEVEALEKIDALLTSFHSGSGANAKVLVRAAQQGIANISTKNDGDTDVVAVEEEYGSIAVFPNPLQDGIFISGISSADVQLQVCTMNGKIVAEHNLSKEPGTPIYWRINQIPNGSYLLIITTGVRQYRKKLILQ